MGNIVLYRGDITKLDCEAIVNAANRSLLGGGGVDGAIHRAAGPGLLEECRTLGGCNTGEAKVTGGYNLKARYVIHTVGPIYSGKAEDALKLSACYANSLDKAREKGVHTVAFPAISTGVYGYPEREAARTAKKAVLDWFDRNDSYQMEVVMVCFNEETYRIYKDLGLGR